MTMEKSFTMNIADIRFRFRCDDERLNFNFSAPDRQFEDTQDGPADADYQIVHETSVEFPALSDEEPLWDSENWKLSKTVDDLLLLEVAYHWQKDCYQKIALIEKDYSSGFLFPKLFKPEGKAYDLPFQWPAREQIMGNRLARFNTGLIHCSSILYKGKILLFSGPSGVGKSTTGRLWTQDGHPLLNDERNLIRIVDGKPVASSTPWHGEIPDIIPKSAPLGALFFLEQASENSLERLSPALGTARLLANAIAPHYDRASLDLIVDAFAQAAEQVPAYILRCRPEAAMVELCQKELEGLW